MNQRLAGFVVLVALLSAPAATAKGQPFLCGESGCVTLEAGAWQSGLWSADGGQRETPGPAPYYRIGAAPNSSIFWVPSVRLLHRVDRGGVASWSAPSPEATATLTSATAALQPYPAPDDALVLVDHHDVRNPGSYLRLFTAGERVFRWPRSVRWLPIRIFTDPASPWGDGADSLWISKRGEYLMRNRQVVRLSTTLAARVRLRLPLN